MGMLMEVENKFCSECLAKGEPVSGKRPQPGSKGTEEDDTERRNATVAASEEWATRLGVKSDGVGGLSVT